MPMFLMSNSSFHIGNRHKVVHQSSGCFVPIRHCQGTSLVRAHCSVRSPILSKCGKKGLRRIRAKLCQGRFWGIELL
jgi:hypothetical protein